MLLCIYRARRSTGGQYQKLYELYLFNLNKFGKKLWWVMTPPKKHDIVFIDGMYIRMFVS